MDKDEIFGLLKLCGEGKYLFEDREYEMIHRWFDMYILTDEHKEILNKYGYTIYDVMEGRYDRRSGSDMMKIILHSNKVIGSEFFVIIK